MKKSALHTTAISMVWPKSGCGTSRAITTSSNTSANVFAGISGRLAEFTEQPGNNDDKAGLRNSEGCMLTPGKTSQRRAPLISGPKNGVAATADQAHGEDDQR